jgi:tetratricopeptide (TPR) repeat protein
MSNVRALWSIPLLVGSILLIGGCLPAVKVQPMLGKTLLADKEETSGNASSRAAVPSAGVNKPSKQLSSRTVGPASSPAAETSPQETVTPSVPLRGSAATRRQQWPDRASDNTGAGEASPAHLPPPRAAWIVEEAEEPPPARQHRLESTVEHDGGLYPLTLERSDHKHNEHAAQLVKRGYEYLEKKQYRDARKLFHFATELADDMGSAWAGIGYASEGLGERETAFVSFRRATECAGAEAFWQQRKTSLGNAIAAEALAEARLERDAGKPDNAVAMLRQARDYAPDNPELWLIWGGIELEQKKLEAAAEKFQRVLTLDPGNRSALEGLRAAGGEPPKHSSEPVSEAAPLDAEAVSEEFGGAEAPPGREAAAPAVPARGQESLTRGEVANLLAEHLDLTSYARATAPVVVLDTARHSNREAIDEVLQRRLMTSYPNHTFRPEAPVTRGEFAELLVHILELDAGFQRAAVLADAPVLDDVPPYHRNRQGIQIAVALSYLQLDERRQFRPQEVISREEALRAIQLLR